MEGGPADLPPGGALPPQGLPDWGGREDRRLTAILDAVTRSRLENCRGRATGLEFRDLGPQEPFRGEGAHALVDLH